MSYSIDSSSPLLTPLHPASGSKLLIKPAQPNIGGLVSGLDFDSSNPSSEESALLRRSLHEYGVLIFDVDKATDSKLIKIADIFGKVVQHNAYNSTVPSSGQAGATKPKINVIEAQGSHVPRNDVWHIDGAYTSSPPDITLLYGLRLPERGGDTMWLNSTLAYDLLPPALAAYFETLTIVNSFESTGLTSWTGSNPERLADMRVKYPPIEVPLIRQHPETGRKQIYATEAVSGYIKGLSRVASLSLLTFIFEWLRKPELEFRISWNPSVVAVWDNRTVHHRANNDYDLLARSMHRLTVQSRPIDEVHS